MNLHLNLEKVTSQAFPFFHAISDCDTTPSVAGKDKKSFCETWQLFPKILAVFRKMEIVTDISEISEQGFKLLERFFVFLYNHTCDTDDVSIACRMLFTYGNRSIDDIPSTAGVLKQHVLRAELQAGQWHLSVFNCSVWILMQLHGDGSTNTYLSRGSCQKLLQHAESW